MKDENEMDQKVYGGILMSSEGLRALTKTLERPAKPVPEMVALLKRSPPWEQVRTS